MDVDCLAHPALLGRIGHPVAADQHLLVVEREPRDLPADHEVFEEHLVAPSPDILGRGRVLAMRLVELADRAVTERLPERQDVARRVGVVDRLEPLLVSALLPGHGRGMPPSLAASPSRSTLRTSSGLPSRGSSPARTATSPAARVTSAPFAETPRPMRAGSYGRGCWSTSRR